MFTADGRSPPSAVYNESFPTGIPIPYTDVKEEIATTLEETSRHYNIITFRPGSQDLQAPKFVLHQ